MPYRLMCITAHPDDESGAFAGALMLAHETGAETGILCLTEGQAASSRGDARSGEELAQMRRAEFERACRVLEVSWGEVLTYPDGQLLRQDFYELTGVLVDRIRRHRPQVVLTFGSEGGANLHRDHTMASLAATAAFQWAGRAAYYPEQFEAGLVPYAPQKLYYSTAKFVVGRDEREGALAAHTPSSLTLGLGPERKERKLHAFQQHLTQHLALERARSAYDEHFGHEHYLLAAARGARPLAEDAGLFDGVVED